MYRGEIIELHPNFHHRLPCQGLGCAYHGTKAPVQDYYRHTVRNRITEWLPTTLFFFKLLHKFQSKQQKARKIKCNKCLPLLCQLGPRLHRLLHVLQISSQDLETRYQVQMHRWEYWRTPSNNSTSITARTQWHYCN